VSQPSNMHVRPRPYVLNARPCTKSEPATSLDPKPTFAYVVIGSHLSIVEVWRQWPRLPVRAEDRRGAPNAMLKPDRRHQQSACCIDDPTVDCRSFRRHAGIAVLDRHSNAPSLAMECSVPLTSYTGSSYVPDDRADRRVHAISKWVRERPQTGELRGRRDHGVVTSARTPSGVR
jgi:hypothetical protein